MKYFTNNDLKILLATHYDLQGILQQLPGELDLNYHVKSNNGEAYILKISHFGKDRSHLEMQNEAMQHLASKNLRLQLPQVILSGKKEGIIAILDSEGNSRLLRLLTWVPGNLWAKTNPHTSTLLESLGKACGTMCKGLSDFDHPVAHRSFKWNLSEAIWIKEELTHLDDPAHRAIVYYFLDLYEKNVIPNFSFLRKSINHNDLNDYNVVVENFEVKGVIDFGDAVYTHTVNEVAIAAAYAVMDKPDPLTAAALVVKGFHQKFSLTEKEIECIFTLIAMRLAVSVTNSAINRQEEPENEYLQISEQPAWELLKKWRKISPEFAHANFRHACGFSPSPKSTSFQEFTQSKEFKTNSPVQVDWKTTPYTVLDLSVGSLDLGHNQNFETINRFERKVNEMLDEADVEIAVGGYGETRPFYTTDAYLVQGNVGPQWRTVHLGIDVWIKAGTPAVAAMGGVVHSFQNNDAPRDYGPTIILEHTSKEGLTFFTLYGHLDPESLKGMEDGMKIQAGQQIGSIGKSSQNGGWPPHLHFQVMLDMLGNRGDFPGVAFPEEKEIWLDICPDPTVFFPGLIEISSKSKTAQEIQISRSQHLGKSLSLSYKKPLHVVRAFKQYLYDTNGRRFLDTVNNVPHVGHQHPRVVRAAQRQMSLLNTNTRYLHENITGFAEELLATFPPELSVCYFVNSGSEANELALRMAQAYSGQKDMIAIEVGYHGNTGACIDISSYKFDGKGGKGAPPHTHIVPIPDTYRGLYRSSESHPGQQYATHIQQAIENIQSQDRNIAGFICESIISCGGQIVLPEGYLKEAYAAVRKAGGVCIADEVQVGFGRVGDHFWGFELQGVVPDIVTLGKPMGNGHPLAAVVVTQQVAEAFTNGMEYFNTFGGNPVSCAIGREVLQVVKDENLQQHAQKVGGFLKRELQTLQSTFPLIGDVRGHGLFLGFELVRNRETLEPADTEATYLVNRMRDHGILMSTDGPFHNVIKIKPPMCFDEGNVAFLIETLDKVLREELLM